VGETTKGLVAATVSVVDVLAWRRNSGRSRGRGAGAHKEVPGIIPGLHVKPGCPRSRHNLLHSHNPWASPVGPGQVQPNRPRGKLQKAKFRQIAKGEKTWGRAYGGFPDYSPKPLEISSAIFPLGLFFAVGKNRFEPLWPDVQRVQGDRGEHTYHHSRQTLYSTKQGLYTLYTSSQ